jgi:hypothetical protein
MLPSGFANSLKLTVTTPQSQEHLNAGISAESIEGAKYF